MTTDDARYASVVDLIHDTCWKFQRSQGGHYDDLLSNANLAYMQAVQTFDPNKGAKFSTWVRYKIWKGLLESRRTESRKGRPEPLPDDVAAPVRLCVTTLLLELSPDAAQCILTVLDPTPDLLIEIGRRPRTAKPIRDALSDLFVGLGWSGHRVATAFAEVQRGLS